MWVKNRETVTDWGEILQGVELPRGIQPSDIDGVIEINHNFLFLECKHPTEKTKRGQRLMLERLAKMRGVTVIRIIRGDDGVEEIYNYGTRKTTRTSPVDFIALIEGWAEKADATKP